MPLITCNNVSIKYDSGLAVKDASFALNSGDYLCVIGENGSGKSTLMKGILGLIKVSGDIKFSGVSRAEIGYLPQQTAMRKDFPASVSEVVLSGCISRGATPFYKWSDRERAKQSMEKLGIKHLSKKSYRELSVGQRQRALFARALCAAEKLLMLDEPAAGLDPVGTSEMYALLNTLNREEGITIMMISHDIQSAVKYSNKILHMRISPLYFGSPADYINTPEAALMLGGAAGA